MIDIPVVKKPVGRPRKHPLVEREPKREPTSTSFKMRAKSNWENFDASAEDTPDRLRIKPTLIPEGMTAQWVTDSIYGQGVPQHRSEFEKKGWTPVHQEDFDGQFDGMFMPKGAAGEIAVEGLVLMMRPKEFTDSAKKRDLRKAREQVSVKEAAWRGGDIATSLDSQHPSALRTNRIRKSVEKLDIPE